MKKLAFILFFSLLLGISLRGMEADTDAASTVASAIEPQNILSQELFKTILRNSISQLTEREFTLLWMHCTNIRRTCKFFNQLFIAKPFLDSLGNVCSNLPFIMPQWLPDATNNQDLKNLLKTINENTKKYHAARFCITCLAHFTLKRPFQAHKLSPGNPI